MKMTRRNFLKDGIALAATSVLITKTVPLMANSEVITLAKMPSSSQVDRSRLLACLAEVETGNDDTKVGPCGSRSRYGLHKLTWYDYSQLDFQTYCRGRAALEVAHLHLNWLIKHLSQPTPYRLAYAWNRGLTYTERRGHIGSGFAFRVHNLYHDSSFLTAVLLNNSNDEFATAYRKDRPQSFPTNSTG